MGSEYFHFRLILVILFLALLPARIASSVIVTYDCEKTTGELGSSFLPNVCELGWIEVISGSSDLLDLQFVAPFFGIENAHWYASLNGFLTIGPYSMCGSQGFCHDFYFNTLYGFYNFESMVDVNDESYECYYGGGGDWPMIGLFVAPIANFVDSGVGAICGQSIGEENELLVIQYQNVFLSQNSAAGPLIAQIQLSKSGEIKLFYEVVPSWDSSSKTSENLSIPYPSTGIVFSKDWLVKMSTPTGSDNLPITYSCTPVKDRCGAIPSSECEAQNSSCILCQATQTCLNSSIVDKLCPSFSFTTPPTKNASANNSIFTASNNSTSDHNVSIIEQRSARTSSNAGGLSEEEKVPLASSFQFSPGSLTGNASVLPTSNELNGKRERQEPVVTMAASKQKVASNSIYSDVAHAEGYTYYDTTVNFGINATILNNQSENYSIVPLWLSSSPIQLSIPFSFPFFGHTILPGSAYFIEPGIVSFGAASQPCNPIWNTCPNGNYSFAILPYQTAMYWTFYSTLISAVIKDDSSNEAFFIMQVSGLSPVSTKTDFDVNSPIPSVSFQVNISSSGRIGIQLFGMESSSDYLLLAYPSPLVGLVRNTTGDPMSVMIPSSLIRSNTSIIFTPRVNKSDTCGGCGSRGTCDTETKMCTCHEHFGGEKCDSCAVGYYGLYCNLTRPQRNCSEGDDVCECPSGWKGPNCSLKADNCMPLSFSGCPSCLELTGCNFCFDNTCYDPSIIGAFGGYTCSYNVNQSSRSLCHLLPQTPVPPSSRMTVTIVLIVLCYVVLVLSIFISVYIHSWYSGVQENVLTANAVMGTATMIPPDRTRSVLPIERVTNVNDKENQFVLGVPIQQAPLKKLYERRLAEKNREKWENLS